MALSACCMWILTIRASTIDTAASSSITASLTDRPASMDPRLANASSDFCGEIMKVSLLRAIPSMECLPAK